MAFAFQISEFYVPAAAVASSSYVQVAIDRADLAQNFAGASLRFREK